MTSQPKQRSLGLRLNLWALRASRRWLRVAITLLAIYVAGTFAAPTFMQLGWEGPARALYLIYSPFCHQFGFRSLFLYGDQPVYPLSTAGTGWQPYERYVEADQRFSGASSNPSNVQGFVQLQLAAREYIGNAQMGYKMTLCARDVAIYSGMLVGAILFGFMRSWLRPVPLWLYVILGLGPIGLDGFSQLLGYPPFNLWQPRETIPEFRVLTGLLFGLMNVWLAFPYLELSLRETREQIEQKLRTAGIEV